MLIAVVIAAFTHASLIANPLLSLVKRNKARGSATYISNWSGDSTSAGEDCESKPHNAKQHVATLSVNPYQNGEYCGQCLQVSYGNRRPMSHHVLPRF
ncbi:hypothetical protein BC937DRAFT_89903 [Endogone sp. FLAS-F59071]|nr:hypothetical protein BC937DRAFT_89903 [Endogone sp. FLAS-F59071]|eukprot:RUS22244.1 hypothetical protein BC937DRAFT_89903 [Endogone sp. FLAS-F59071]